MTHYLDHQTRREVKRVEGIKTHNLNRVRTEFMEILQGIHLECRTFGSMTNNTVAEGSDIDLLIMSQGGVQRCMGGSGRYYTERDGLQSRAAARQAGIVEAWQWNKGRPKFCHKPGHEAASSVER